MFNDLRIFRRSDPDFPTTAALQRQLVDAGRVEGEGPLASRRSFDSQMRPGGTAPVVPKAPPPFSDADLSLIRKIHGYVPQAQLLGILNDRLQGNFGTSIQPYTIEQLHAAIDTVPGAKQGGDRGWAGLRKVLAQARRAGTLDLINEQVISDFAVVFSLSAKQLIRLKEILLQPKED